MTNKQRGYYTLKINDKERTLHFSMTFWAKFTETLGIELSELDKVFSDKKALGLDTLGAILYSSALAYDLVNENVVDYNIHVATNWLSDVTPEQLAEIVSVMTQSRILGNDMNAGINRNVTKTTKKTTAKKK